MLRRNRSLSRCAPVVASPETAGVGADLVGQDDRAVGQAAKLELKVHQTDVGVQHDLLQHLVDLEGILRDGVQLPPG